jgi:CRISPR-associated protein Cas5d
VANGDIGPPLDVKVWGEWACFTRPEMKVERVSYPVMTPSAARGALESIFWKPEFVWQVREIRVLKEIRYFSILRNEVNSRASDRAARDWAKQGAGGYIASEDRSQRHTLALREVAYVIRADAVPRSGNPDDAAKYRDQFRRRVQRGQCFLQPYLGCREFSAAFGEPTAADQPIHRTEDLGPMLLDIAYEPGGGGRGQPLFFPARLENGVLRVPETPGVIGDGPW